MSPTDPPADGTMPDVDVRPWLADHHHDDLAALFREQWWTAARTPEQVERVLAGSQVLVSAVNQTTDRLVGFSRVLSDDTILAVVLDVMVAEEWRGRGIGARLMDTVLAHPRLADVQSIELVCQARLFPFYARWGFTDQVGGSRLMRRTATAALLGPTP